MNKKYNMAKDLPLSDEQIIDMYWARNEEAIPETDKKYGNYLFTVAKSIVSDKLDCEECLNDTYLGTWNKIPPERPNIFRAFLTRIMRNIAIDRFRKNSAKRRIPSEMQVSLDELENCITATPSVEEEYLTSKVAEVLSVYLRSLSRRKEMIFVCRYYYADRIADIAKMLGVSENTVFRELAEIRAGLRERLEREGYYFEEK